MPRVVHVAVTRNAAGVERYVCAVAVELAKRDWAVSVVGGDPERIPALLPEEVRWLPGGEPFEALRSLRALGRQDVCHAHMTVAEAVSVASRPLHRAPVVTTRHFAARRGSSLPGRILAPLIARGLSREIAISEFVAAHTERAPDAVLRNAVPASPNLWHPSSRVVLVLQRLDAEKDTITALRAWEASRMWEEGWSLRIVGTGDEQGGLERWADRREIPAVTFAGWVSDVSSELASAGMLLATAPAEPFGLSVVEAMAAGVPVVAAAGGGHLETVALLDEPWLFPPGDAEAAAHGLQGLLPDASRAAASRAGRELVASQFSLSAHVDQLIDEYQEARKSARPQGSKRLRPPSPDGEGGLSELVVCSLEPWDDVWRRNQFFVDILLRRNPLLRVLFVEPPADPLHDLSQRRRPSRPRLRTIGYEGRLRALRPVKVLPRLTGETADNLLRAQARVAARSLGFRQPTLWINDVTYAPLIRATGWPSVYDVTDDWLAAPFAARELKRLAELERVALDNADEVVVCSEALAKDRGRIRTVHVVSNAVDVEHFRKARPRPDDLPPPPVAVYVGTLHESRLDLDLAVGAARALPEIIFAFIGPIALASSGRRRLAMERNVALLGARPYVSVPAYLQHADAIFVPHLVNRFTESLDPIKAYECVAAGTPTVATPVAGFRGLAGAVSIALPEQFAPAVRLATSRKRVASVGQLATWEDRAAAFEAIVTAAAARED